jgi:hypothetical protein
LGEENARKSRKLFLRFAVPNIETKEVSKDNSSKKDLDPASVEVVSEDLKEFDSKKIFESKWEAFKENT